MTGAGVVGVAGLAADASVTVGLDLAVFALAVLALLAAGWAAAMICVIDEFLEMFWIEWASVADAGLLENSAMALPNTAAVRAAYLIYSISSLYPYWLTLINYYYFG